MIKGKPNNYLKFLIPALLVAGILVYLFLDNNLSAIKTTSNDLEENSVADLLIPVPYNWPLFYTAVEKQAAKIKTEENENQTNTGAVAAIAPHHDLAAEYTAELFSKLSGREIKTIIVIGPNHENSGTAAAITGKIDYRLLDGVVETDEEWVDWLVQEKIATSDPSRFVNEHSIYALVPYIKYYFPDAKIVPIILKNNFSQEQAMILGWSLANRIRTANEGEDAIIIGSIDFSHYLSTEQANLKDLETREAIINRDYSRLYSFNDDHLDSPMTATTILEAATILGGDKTEIVANVNQAEATGLVSVPSSTSYFTIIFRGLD